MGERGLRQDAVAEIEDERSLGEHLEDAVDRTIERRAACHPHQGVEISLHRYAPLDLIAREREIDGPIEPHGIDRDLLDVAQKRCADAAWKSDHPRPWHVPAHLCDDSLRRLDAPAAEL